MSYFKVGQKQYEIRKNLARVKQQLHCKIMAREMLGNVASALNMGENKNERKHQSVVVSGKFPL